MSYYVRDNVNRFYTVNGKWGSDGARIFKDMDELVRWFSNHEFPDSAIVLECETHNCIGSLQKLVEQHEQSILSNSDVDSNLKNLCDTMLELSKYLNNYDKVVEVCQKKISECDLETQDYLHAIEFNNCNAAQGFKLYKELQVVRRRRRGYKDLLFILEAFGRPGIQRLQNAIGVIKRLDNREYTPRIKSDIFL